MATREPQRALASTDHSLGTLALSQTKSFRVRGIKFHQYKSIGSILNLSTRLSQIVDFFSFRLPASKDRTPTSSCQPTHSSPHPQTKVLASGSGISNRKGRGVKKERERRGLKWCPLALVFTCHTYASKSHSSPGQCYVVLVKAVCTSAFQHRVLGSR